MFDLGLFAEKAEEIIAAGRFLYANGWSPATSSNYSARLDEEHVAITVSGRHKGQLTPRDIMVVDLSGAPVFSEARPSAETLLHTSIYKIFPDTNAVLHTHSLAATVLTRYLGETSSLVLKDYELQKAFEGQSTHEGSIEIPIFDNTQDIPMLAAQAELYLKHHQPPGYLIRGHGLYTWGATMKACLRHMEALEFLLSCELEMARLNPKK